MTHVEMMKAERDRVNKLWFLTMTHENDNSFWSVVVHDMVSTLLDEADEYIALSAEEQRKIPYKQVEDIFIQLKFYQ